MNGANVLIGDGALFHGNEAREGFGGGLMNEGLAGSRRRLRANEHQDRKALFIDSPVSYVGIGRNATFISNAAYSGGGAIFQSYTWTDIGQCVVVIYLSVCTCCCLPG